MHFVGYRTKERSDFFSNALMILVLRPNFITCGKVIIEVMFLFPYYALTRRETYIQRGHTHRSPYMAFVRKISSIFS